MMKISPELEKGRFNHGAFASPRGAPYGVFQIQGPCGMMMTIVATPGYVDTDYPGSEDWEHVSVSGRRIPNWEEMCFVRKLFWEEEDWIVQFHPPKTEYVNNHTRCLHLWRYKGKFPTPASTLVGFRDIGRLT